MSPVDQAAFDVAVIGGGVLGCAAAYYLVRGGANVLVLEKSQINSQASAQNAGSLHFHLERRMLEHGEGLVEHFATAIPLHLRAEEAWRGLEAELGQDLEIEQHGGVVVAETAEEVAALRRKVAIEQKWGLETTLITGREARDRIPALAPSIAAASFYPGEGHANPRFVAPAYLKAADPSRLTVRTETTVVGLSKAQGRWVVHLAGGEGVLAEAVLVAAGAWSGNVLAMAHTTLPIIPVGLGMVATARTGNVLGHLIQHVGDRLTLKQVRDGNILIGGGWPALLERDKRNGVDLDRRPRVMLDSVGGSISVARRTVPGIAGLPVIRAWSGLVGVAADQLPVLGEIPRRPGLFSLIGGFTLGPAYGEIISDEILSSARPEELSLYRPARFGHLNLV